VVDYRLLGLLVIGAARGCWGCPGLPVARPHVTDAIFSRYAEHIEEVTLSKGTPADRHSINYGLGVSWNFNGQFWRQNFPSAAQINSLNITSELLSWTKSILVQRKITENSKFSLKIQVELPQHARREQFR